LRIFKELDRSVSDIVRASSKGVCGITEREITVPSSKVEITKRKLREGGFQIIGTSEPNGRNRKIWFIRRGVPL